MSDFVYLGLYDPTGFERFDDMQRDFHGINSAVRDIHRAVTQCLEPDRCTFVLTGGAWVAPRRLESGVTLLSRQDLAEWLTTQRCAIIAHDVTANGMWMNTCRRATNSRNVALVITMHSLSYERSGTDFALRLLAEPLRDFDRIVVPSQCGAEALKRSFDGLERNGISVPLETIPHPVDSGYFASGKRSRAAWGLGEADVVFLYAGRLSPSDKADLLPLLIAFRVLANEVAGVRLLLAGWDYVGYGDWLEGVVVEQGLAKNVKIVRSPSRSMLRDVMHASDCCIIMSDSIQETHGLTALEAMSVGLPVIAPDWDGYRETIRSQEHGILIPTLRTSSSASVQRYCGWQHDHYLVHQLLARQVAVSVTDLVQAMKVMVEDPGLRNTMGRAAAMHVRARFDCVPVGKDYARLFDTLAADLKEKAHVGWDGSPYAWDQWKVFGHYATSVLTDDMMVGRGPVGIAGWQCGDTQRENMGLGVDPTYVEEICEMVATTPKRLGDIRLAFADGEEDKIQRAIILGVKYGALLIQK